jgi:uncharacterized protein
MAPISPVPGAVLLRIHVQPRASRTEVVGLHGDAIKVRLAAPPVDGAANEELARFLARALGVPRRAVTITAGAGSRTKTVRVDGVTPEVAWRSLLTEV